MTRPADRVWFLVCTTFFFLANVSTASWATNEIQVSSAHRIIDCSGVVPGNAFGDETEDTGTGLFDPESISFSESGNGYLAYNECSQTSAISGLSLRGELSSYAEVVPGQDQAASSNAESKMEVEFQVVEDAAYSFKVSFDVEADPGGAFSNSPTLISASLEGYRPNGDFFKHDVTYYHDGDPPFNEFSYEGAIGAGQPVTFQARVRSNRSVSTLPDFNTPGAAHANLEVVLDLGDLELVGLEVVQTVQDWHNSVPLIRNKQQTLVRAHLQSVDPQPVHPILRGYLDGIEILPPLTAENRGGQLTPPEDAQAVRANLNKNAWFVLPPSWIDHDQELTVKLELDSGDDLGVICLEPAEPDDLDCQTTVTFEPSPTMRVRFIDMTWNDAQGGAHSPPGILAIDLEDRALAAMPLNDGGLQAAFGTMTLGGVGLPTTTRAVTALARKRVRDGCNEGCPWLYYGILADGNGISGRADGIPGGSAVGFSSDLGAGRQTVSHELGHLLGRQHSSSPSITSPANLSGSQVGACCAPTKPFASDFPTTFFENFGLPDDACGAVSGGLRPALGLMDDGDDLMVYGYESLLKQVVDPQKTFDMMGYCDSAPVDFWPSSFTYKKMFEFLNSPAPRRGRSQRGSGDFLMITGTVDYDDDSVVIETVDLVEDIVAPLGSPPGDFLIRYRDAGGVELSTTTFQPTQGLTLDSPNNDGAFVLFQPVSADIHSFEIESDGMIRASRTASSNAPTVEVVSPNGGETIVGDTVDISWTKNDVDGDSLVSTVQYSPDGGLSWLTLAELLTDTSLQVQRSALPKSDAGVVRVQVSDGFHHASDESNGLFSVDNNPPVVHIGSLASSPYFWSGQTIHLAGGALDPEDGELDGASLEWSSNLAGSLGFGQSLDIAASSLAPGKHQITVTATDSDGATGIDGASLWVDVEVEIFADGFESGDLGAWVP